MPSHTSLVELAGDIAQDRRDVGNRARYLRRAGILGPSSKDPSFPDADAVHGAIVLIPRMWAGNQSDVAERLRAIWNLHWSAVQRHEETQGGVIKKAPDRVPAAAGARLRFGPEIVSIINAEAEKPGSLPDSLIVTVWRDSLLASITSARHTNYFGEPNAHRRKKANLETMTTATVEVFRELGAFVRQSREEAARRGITINIADTYRALGDEPPGQQPSLPFSKSVPASTGSDESKEAAPRLPAGSNLSIGRPASVQAALAMQEQFSLTDSLRATPLLSSSQLGRPPSKGGRRRDGSEERAAMRSSVA